MWEGPRKKYPYRKEHSESNTHKVYSTYFKGALEIGQETFCNLLSPGISILKNTGHLAGGKGGNYVWFLTQAASKNSSPTKCTHVSAVLSWLILASPYPTPWATVREDKETAKGSLIKCREGSEGEHDAGGLRFLKKNTVLNITSCCVVLD